MRLFNCRHCNNPLYFENSICLSCGFSIGFDPVVMDMITLIHDHSDIFSDTENKVSRFRYCHNFQYATCNWLINPQQSSPFCQACELNRMIPDLSIPQNLIRWKKIETAKHRLIYSLKKLEVPVNKKQRPEDTGLQFDFLADVQPNDKVVTGHMHGLITLNIEEADETERVKNKNNLGENYRTLLGHLRHESGHYYWELLIKENQERLEKFRRLFGNEQKDYSFALRTYYESGASEKWTEEFISAYASAHPWEDWAETWSHYLHMMDTLETAYYFGIAINPAAIENDQELKARIRKDPYSILRIEEIIKIWLPLTFAINSLNRSMGHQDFYPFVISEKVKDKLRFIHEIAGSRRFKT